MRTHKSPRSQWPFCVCACAIESAALRYIQRRIGVRSEDRRRQACSWHLLRPGQPCRLGGFSLRWKSLVGIGWRRTQVPCPGISTPDLPIVGRDSLVGYPCLCMCAWVGVLDRLGVCCVKCRSVWSKLLHPIFFIPFLRRNADSSPDTRKCRVRYALHVSTCSQQVDHLESALSDLVRFGVWLVLEKGRSSSFFFPTPWHERVFQSSFFFSSLRSTG